MGSMVSVPRNSSIAVECMVPAYRVRFVVSSICDQLSGDSGTKGAEG